MQKQTHNIVEIRLLPNSKETFPTLDSFVNYLEGRWTTRGGRYYFPTTSIKFAGDTLVLFQYAGTLVASAVLVDVINETVIDEDGASYGGQYVFDTDTLQIFSIPITCDEFLYAYPELGSFSQSKRKVPIENLSKVYELINKATK